MKLCPKCQLPKPESEFSKNKAANNGLCTYCKPCDSERSKRWHHQHPGLSNQPYYRRHPEKWKASQARLAADPVRLLQRKKVQARNKKRRLEEAIGKALRLSGKVEA